jgi:hypothetical protein
MQGVEGMTMPTTITNVANLSDEVKSGQIHGVIQLYKLLDDKPALEKKPADIFARTYLTDALRTALDQIRYKFARQDQRGSLVFTGGYGSGKSHQLLALYHTLTHPDLVAQWLSRHGYDEPLPRLDDLAVIVLHTARFDYDNLWEPVFQQLDAQDVLNQVKRYPTIPQIRQALAGRPVVIIIDEIENWYETILPQRVSTAETSRAANRTFLQHLLEVANEPDVPLMVFFSLLRDNPDIVDVIDRTEPISINLSTAADREEILLYRLFESVDEQKAAAVVERFTELYRERQIAVPMGDYEAYRVRMGRVYPLHPELLRVLFERYSTASNYANTRGILYLLATVLRERADRIPLLLASDVDAARFNDQLVVLDRPLVEATARDIERVGHIDYGREILSTVLLYSINREQQIGASETETVMGVATPEINPNDVLLGLNRLLGQAWHLHKLNGQFAVRIEENVFAVVQNRARDISEKAAIQRIAQVLAKEVLKGNTHVYEIDEIPDDRHLKVVVSLRALDTDQDVYAIYHGHRYQNRMVMLAPLTGDLRNDQNLMDKAKRVIGGEEIKKDVSDERAVKVQDIIDEELKELKERLAARFGFWPKVSVMVSEGPDGQRIEEEAVRKIQVEADTASLLKRAVSDIARVKEKILDVLRERGPKGLRADLLYSDFYTIRRYPMVSDASHVTAALKELCREEQLYIEGHKGRNFFGETPYGLDGQSRAMLYHADFAQVQRGPTGEAEKVEIAFPEGKALGEPAKEPVLEQVIEGVEVTPQRITEQLYLEEGGKHPRTVAGKFEAILRETDVIQHVQVEISNDFSVGGKSDKLERLVKNLGFPTEGLKLGLTLEWSGPLEKGPFLQQLLSLPATPGGSLYVIAEVDRVIE